MIRMAQLRVTWGLCRTCRVVRAVVRLDDGDPLVIVGPPHGPGADATNWIVGVAGTAVVLLGMAPLEVMGRVIAAGREFYTENGLSYSGNVDIELNESCVEDEEGARS